MAAVAAVVVVSVLKVDTIKCARVKLQRSRLETEEPEKYGFRQKELLGKILSIYINLEEENRPEFVEAIVKDTRSFKVELFEEALRIIRNGLVVPVETAMPGEAATMFERLVEKVKEAAQSNMEVKRKVSYL